MGKKFKNKDLGRYWDSSHEDVLKLLAERIMHNELELNENHQPRLVLIVG